MLRNGLNMKEIEEVVKNNQWCEIIGVGPVVNEIVDLLKKNNIKTDAHCKLIDLDHIFNIRYVVQLLAAKGFLRKTSYQLLVQDPAKINHIASEVKKLNESIPCRLTPANYIRLTVPKAVAPVPAAKASPDYSLSSPRFYNNKNIKHPELKIMGISGILDEDYFQRKAP